ncbi:hypothetical protein CHUAL_011884 [Chamberlinius hualienensis]
MAFFGGNPFSTPVGQRIEQATDASLASENWALNMEICDIINETDDAARDAIKAIRKRLTQNVGKNYTVVMYTLTVLETCVKNCGRRFHLLVTNKEFVQELVKLIGPKNDPPTAVQEKVLSLIQCWADAFKGIPEMVGVVQVYQDLKQKGVEFPMTDLDAMAPIHTPQRSVPESEIPSHPIPVAPRPTTTESRASPTPVIATPVGPVNLIPEQLGKLKSELDLVQGNMTIFSEMLSELAPGHEHPSDWELLNELHITLTAMQTRIVELVDKVASEEVTVELLRVNDELNNLFLRFSRFEKNRVGGQTPKSPQTQADIHTNSSAPLIDLGDSTTDTDIQSRLAGLAVGSGTVSSTLSQMQTVPAHTADDEFDMFAQSRKATYETTKNSGSTYSDNIHFDQVSVGLGTAAQLRNSDDKTILQKESDFTEMEAWLGEKTDNQEQTQPHSVTSTEFDRFLADRAAAAEHSNGRGGSSRPGARRQMEKDEQDSALFAL